MARGQGRDGEGTIVPRARAAARNKDGLGMDKHQNLKPCPFCGDDQPVLLYSAVRCRICGAVGPYSGSDEQAIKKWNARPILLFQSQDTSDHDEVKRLVRD